MNVLPAQPQTSPGSPPKEVWKHPAIPYLLLALVTVAVYLPVRQFDYIGFDDPDYMQSNQTVQRGLTAGNIVWAFKTGHAANWHPLTWLSHMLDVSLFGNSPGAAHVVNLLFHTANTLLLLLLLQTLTGTLWRSAFVAAIFALHPLHVESVAWISERKDILSTFFGLLCFWGYVKYAAARQYKRKSNGEVLPAREKFPLGYYLFSLLCLALGLLSKPMLVTWPFVLLLLDHWPLQRFRPDLPTISQLVREKIPFFLLSAGSCAATFFVQRSGGAVVSLVRHSLGDRMGNVFVSYARYLGKTFWPEHLILPDLHPLQWPTLVVAGSMALVVGLSVVALWQRRRWPFAITGWFWFVGMLVPVIGLVQVGEQSLADRYMYVPLTGITIVVTWGAAAVFERLRAARIIPCAISVMAVCACAILTKNQLGYWRNSETLFRHTLSVSPDNYYAHLCLGRYFLDKNRPEAAAEHFQAILRQSPNDPSPLQGLGQAMAAMKKYPEAIGYFEHALRVKPDHTDAHQNLGLVLADLGQTEAAIEHYRAAIQTAPGFTLAHYRLGNALLKLGKNDEAIAEYYIAVQQQPNFVNALNNLGAALLSRQRLDEANTQFRTILRYQPDHAGAHFNLGNTSAKAEKWSEAAEHYAAALRTSPNNAPIRYGLGLALSRLGRRAEAIPHLAEALRLNPNDAKARRELELLQATPP